MSERTSSAWTTAAVRLEDEPFLLALYAATRREEVAAWGWDAAQAEAFFHLQFRARQRSYEMQYPEADRRIIRCGGRPIGSIMTARRAEEIVLVDIALLPDQREAGIGTALVRALQQEAAAAKVVLRLSVSTENRARELYERLGFRVTGENQAYYAMEWSPHLSRRAPP